MSDVITIIDDGGETRVRAADLPVSAGGADADVRLGADAADETLVWLDLADGRPYAQPGAGRVFVNGELLEASRWLRDGDVLTLGGGRLVCGVGREVSFHAVSREARQTRPPPAELAGEAHEIVQPIAFLPTAGGAGRGGPRLRPVPVAIAGLFAVMAGLAWQLLTARSVDLQIAPEPDSVAVRGGLLTPRIGGRYLLHPRSYTVEATKEGYHDLETSIEVGRSANQQIALTMRKLPGLLTVETTPVDGAVVTVDGVELGRTPLVDVPVEAGLHRVVVRLAKYLPHDREIEIEGLGQPERLAFEMVPNWAPVSFSSTPDGAVVTVDGKAVGETPLTTEVEGGERDVRIKRDGYRGVEFRITVVSGEAQDVPAVTLVEADGLLALTTVPSGAGVTVGGDYVGLSPLTLELRPGRQHRIGLAKPGYREAVRTVRLEPEQRRDLDVRLEPRLGTLRIVADPADAEVLVDGESRGSADLLSLTAAPHRIEIRKTGYESYVQTVTPQEGLEQRIAVALRTLEEARVAALEPTITAPTGLELKLIEPGRFFLGSDRRDQGRQPNEVRREAELTREFYVGATEVTNAQFREFLATHSSGFVSGVTLDGDDQPVVRVSWQQAARFCNWLSQQASLPPAYVERDNRLVGARPMTTGFRLPTEAEWTWVARYAGSRDRERRYPWGNSLPVPPGAGNYADQSAAALVSPRLEGYDDGFAATAPVASFDPNELGLYDLGGNVSEWMHDFYEVAPLDPYQLLIDPLGPADGPRHVVRGSSWRHAGITELRFSWRDQQGRGQPDLGLRVARYAN